MDTNNIILQNLTAQDLSELIDKRLTLQFEQLRKDLAGKSDGEELLTRERAANYLSIDLSTLHLWTKAGKLAAFGIGARRYYRRSDLNNALKPLNP